ncbi:hypothetical protein B0J13DRAFT_524538 [Dactylonectria estremocensis]|uniref:Uncharacterized protein n=1 Tax=Dactylonectria estremocensis TaxID=1079267 RepID=A0A9P9EWX2_9HYPO|nr:hypothetical protein B0J13DRAFT_524538 [Dactylonectria estremocensis]
MPLPEEFLAESFVNEEELAAKIFLGVREREVAGAEEGPSTTLMISSSKVALRFHQSSDTAQAYAQGLDTDEDEVRLDDLTDAIQEVERTLLKTIDGTGLDVAGIVGTFQEPTSGPPPAPVVVMGTQPMFQSSVNMSMASKVATPTSEMGTRVVHETQLPKSFSEATVPASIEDRGHSRDESSR